MAEHQEQMDGETLQQQLSQQRQGMAGHREQMNDVTAQQHRSQQCDIKQ